VRKKYVKFKFFTFLLSKTNNTL